MRRRRAFCTIAICAAILPSLTCSDSTGPSFGPAAVLQVLSGDGQTASVAVDLPVILTVKVLDSQGRTVPAQPVIFSVTSGRGAVVGVGASESDDSGVVRARWTLGTSTTDSQRVEARAVEHSSGSVLARATFRATALPGPATRLVFSTQPSSATAGAAMAPAVQVAVTDTYGNVVTSSTAGVALAVTAGTGASGSVLTGTLTLPASNGVATFGDLTLDRAATGYTLTATSAGLTSCVSGSFAVVAGNAAKLVFSIQPTSATAGAAFAPAPQVLIQDTYGNTVTSSAAAVAVAITSGTGAGGAVLGGATSQQALAGIATFASVNVAKAGTGYTLTASSPGLASASSANFDVSPGPASKLEFIVQPTDVTAGDTIAPAVQIAFRDTFDNLATSSSALVTISLTSGTGPSGASLGGTTSQPATAGVAAFNNLLITKSGSGYSLTATSTGISSATSGTLSVAPGSAAVLAFATQPSDATAGAAISPAVRIVVQDTFANTVTSATSAISVAIAPGSGRSGANLRGTKSAVAVGGTATFSGLSVDSAATGYQLAATASSLTGATSIAFSVSVAPAAKLAFVTQPSDATAGVAIVPVIRVAIEDSVGNRVPTASNAVTIDLGSGPSGAMLFGNATVDAVSGIASFADLRLRMAGMGYSLTAAGSGLNGASSAQFIVAAAPASQLGFTTLSGRMFIGGPKATPLGVAIQDSLGNTVTAATSPITISLGTNPVGATLSGPVTTNAVSGIAAFANFSINWAGGGYTLLGTATGLVQAASSPFDVVTLRGISTGVYSTCAVTTDSAGYCWGGANYGVLGSDQPSAAVSPKPISGGLSLSTVSISEAHACGLTGSGAAYCWGDNEVGQLGVSSPIVTASPVGVTGGLSFQSIGAGWASFTCGLTVLGAAYCWGSGGHGQLGNGTWSSSASPVPVSVGTTFVSLAVGGAHVCGLTADGRVYCWGDNTKGQLGDGTTTTPTTPVAVVGGVTFASVAAGAQSTCGLSTSGDSYCWGNGYPSTPSSIPGGVSFASLSVGGGACGITAAGVAYCWGVGGTPTLVPGGLTWSVLSPGINATCGLTTDYELYCWGWNGRGGLGDGTLVDRSVPTRVMSP